MKKIYMVLVILLSLSLVGCTYSVKDQAAFKEGEEYLQLDNTEETTYVEKLSECISILEGSKNAEKFNDNEKKYNDFKYGILSNVVTDLNEKKELGVEGILIKNSTSIMQLDELNEKQKELYSDDYNKIIDEYIVLFSEIYENYDGKNIDKSYKERTDKLKEEYDVIKNKITDQFTDEMVKWLQDQMPKKYTIKTTIKNK